MYTLEIDKKSLSQLYDVDERTVSRIVSMVNRYSNECPASIIVRIRTACPHTIKLDYYKHLLLIGHIIGVWSTNIFHDDLVKKINNDLLKNMTDICQREN